MVLDATPSRCQAATMLLEVFRTSRNTDDDGSSGGVAPALGSVVCQPHGVVVCGTYTRVEASEVDTVRENSIKQRRRLAQNSTERHMILSVYILIAIHWSTLFSFIYKANTESKRDVVSCRSGQVRAGLGWWCGGVKLWRRWCAVLGLVLVLHRTWPTNYMDQPKPRGA